MNNLEELSQPVAWTDADELADMDCNTYGNIFNAKYINIHNGRWLPFYSQGYVDSLIAQLETTTEKLSKPIAEVISKFGDPETFGEREIKVLIDLRSIPYGTRLFTAAKPEALPRHIYSMLVNELRDVPAIGCKRELIIGVLNRHGVIAEPVQSDPPATE